MIWRNKLIWAPDKSPKIFRFWFQIRWDIQLYVHSAYSQYMYRSILHILSIWTDSFRVFSVYKQQNFVWRFTSFRIFSVYVQILSAYCQYTNRFIQCILSIHTDSFCVFGECAQIILNIRKGIFFCTAFKGILPLKKVCMCAIGPKTY
jgi:hypothetical protein